jgi:hypothetical protein
MSISIHIHRLMFDSPETFSQYWYRSLFALCTYTDWSAMCGWNPKDILLWRHLPSSGYMVPSYPTRMFCNAHIHTYILYRYNMILYLCIRSSIDTSVIPDPDSGLGGLGKHIASHWWKPTFPSIQTRRDFLHICCEQCWVSSLILL